MPSLPISKPSLDEWPDVLKILNHELSGNQTWNLSDEYPTILSQTNYLHSFICKDQNQVVSHAAYFPFKLQTTQGAFPVAAVGQVWTAKSHRGRGLASEILKAMEEEMRAKGYAFAILWTGEPSIYKKIGYTPAGRELDWILEARSLEAIKSRAAPIQVKEIKIEERGKVLPIITSLHSKHRLQISRSATDWNLYAQIPGARWYITSDESAYAIIGKGKDLSNAVHEWGGEAAGLLAIVGQILEKEGGKIFLLGPDDPYEKFFRELHALRIPLHEGIVGYALRLNMSQKQFLEITATRKSEFFFWGFDSV